MKERVLYLIDGSSYIFRAYHAIRSLSTSKGSPTNAIYGFTSMIFKFLKDYSPEYLGIVFDSKGKTFRDEIYPLYKANRDEAPDDFKIQVPKIFEMVDSLGIPQVQIEGYEADDIMGTIAKEMEEKGISVVLVTGDKDFCQLVSEKVTLIDTMRDKKTGIKEVIQRFGVPPESVIDVFALSGDATDNIPGVRGVGEKTASELIGKFRTIESLYENLNELPQRQRDLLEANKESAILSKRLVTIETSIPMSVSLEGFEYKGFNKEKLREIFEELEFKSLLRELGDNEKVQQEIAIIESSGGKVSYDDYHLVLTEMDFDMVLERIDLTKEVSIDLETTSQSPMRAEIVGIALSPASHESYYIPVAHRSTVFDSTKQLNSKYVLEKLKPIVEDNSIKKIGQNLKYEFIVLERNGLRLRGISCDTMVAAHLIDASRLSYSLDELAKYYLEHKTITYKDVTGIGRDKINFEEVELERAKVYACEDADVAMILSKKLASELEKLTLLDVFKDIELKFIEVLARMEMNGVKVNSELLERLSIDFEKSLEKIAEEVYAQVGFRFNLNSPIQLREILFDKLGLPQKKMTKSGEASTDVEVLTELSKFHPVPEKVLEHRGLSKLKSTYIDSFPKLINPRTRRIHTSFNQAGTSTGRLSSSDPNLQNIPVKTPEGRRIREAFIPEDGFLLLSADYSQIELRLLAHFSEDDSLVSAFLAGSDIHNRTAAEIFGVSEDLVTPEMRRRSKTINFGIIYGISPFGLSKQLGISNTIAKSYINEYFKRYRRVKSYTEASIREAERQGYAVTLLGRRRPIPELKSKDRTTRGIGERTAINTPIQGSAADIIKIAMIKIQERLSRDYRSRMILQVHDELLFEIHESEIDDLSRIIKKEMEKAWQLRVPLRVDIGIGKNWAEAH
ncbi:MAG: polA-1, DNA polymerase I, DNA polymerase I [Candidatus Dadabacteria bacterium CSP1-2]|nr:MAG: polA-1, DNA polymerase I, DNA polymerase I [Candidatus Dadabacteria bacterium CSP1-2]